MTWGSQNRAPGLRLLGARAAGNSQRVSCHPLKGTLVFSYNDQW